MLNLAVRPHLSRLTVAVMIIVNSMPNISTLPRYLQLLNTECCPISLILLVEVIISLSVYQLWMAYSVYSRE